MQSQLKYLMNNQTSDYPAPLWGVHPH